MVLSDNVVRGDSIEFEITFDLDLTGYKIRAELYDNSNHCIKIATANVDGGSDSQILITDESNGEFTIFIDNGLTNCFDKNSFMEVEIESATGKITTVMPGANTEVRFKPQKIDWTSI